MRMQSRAAAVFFASLLFPIFPAISRGDGIDRTQPVVPYVSPDQQPDSPFCSNTRPNQRLAQIPLGVKWMRGDALESDDFARAHGYSQLYIIAFHNPAHAVNGSVMGAPKPEFLDADIQKQINLLKAHPDVTFVEFYNEPWWMFTGASMAEFRNDLRKTYLAVKAFNPNITVLASNTPSSTVDDIAVDGGEKYCDGFAPHNYVGCSDPNLYVAPAWRYMDWDRLLMHQFGKSTHWITEGGDQKLPESGGPNGLYTAYKLVQRFAMYSSEEFAKVCTHMPDGGWTSPAMRHAYSILTTLIQDRKPVAEIWPQSMLTWGETYQGRGRSVAILFSWAGKNVQTGAVGTITIKGADDIAAYDVFGSPAGQFDASAHTLKFNMGNAPIYLVSTRSGAELTDAIRAGQVALDEPVKAMIEPMAGPVGPGTPLVVRLYNGGVNVCSGVIDASIPGWTLRQATPFTIQPGKFLAVAIPVQTAAANDRNIYDARAAIAIDGIPNPLNIEQAVQAAYMVRLTPKLDGAMDSWKPAQFVTMATYPAGIDYTTLAYNPHLASGDVKGKQIHNAIAKVYTAYDKDNLYVAYSLNGADRPMWLQLALGLTDWPAHNLRPANDPWAYKGYFIDSDYLFAINCPTGQLWRLASPDATFRSPYNWFIACHGGNPDKNLRFVSDLDYENAHFYDMAKGHGAAIHVSGDPDNQIVQCAIPRSAIPEFKPESGKPIRLSFQLRDTATPEGGNVYEWSKISGEFPFLRGCGSFIPSWQTYYDNQLPWGVN